MNDRIQEEPPELPEELYRDQVDWYDHVYPEVNEEALDLLEGELEQDDE